MAVRAATSGMEETCRDSVSVKDDAMFNCPTHRVQVPGVPGLGGVAGVGLEAGDGGVVPRPAQPGVAQQRVQVLVGDQHGDACTRHISSAGYQVSPRYHHCIVISTQAQAEYN